MRLFILVIFILPGLCYSAQKDMELSGIVESDVRENPNFNTISDVLYDVEALESIVISLEANEVFHLIDIATLEKNAQLSLDTDANHLYNGTFGGRTYTNSVHASHSTSFGYTVYLECLYDGYSTQRKTIRNWYEGYISADDGYLATLYGPGELIIGGGIREYVYVHDNANASYAKLQGTASLKFRLFYEVSKVGSTPSEEKFSVALDNDGSRLAIGTKDGTNTLVRVYEYDGSSWSQLGEDVEQ